MYKSEIIADSLSPQGDRLTTFIVQFPRFVKFCNEPHTEIQ